MDKKSLISTQKAHEATRLTFEFKEEEKIKLPIFLNPRPCPRLGQEGKKKKRRKTITTTKKE